MGRDGEREGRGMKRDGKRRGGGKREKGKGWKREGGKVKEKWEGRDRTWDGTGREGKGKEKGEGKGGEGLQPPKLQFLAPPLDIISFCSIPTLYN